MFIEGQEADSRYLHLGRMTNQCRNGEPVIGAQIDALQSPREHTQTNHRDADGRPYDPGSPEKRGMQLDARHYRDFESRNNRGLCPRNIVRVVRERSQGVLSIFSDPRRFSI